MKIYLESNDNEEKIMLAKALLANGLVSGIESEDCCRKSDAEIFQAVTQVVKMFGVSTQWVAVYRVLVDFCGWESDISKFNQRMNRLLKNVRLGNKCTYQSIQKPLANNFILRRSFKEWKEYKVPAGDRVFSRQMHIARELLKLLSISA